MMPKIFLLMPAWHKRRIGGAVVISTLVAALAVFALACVGGCGNNTKRSESETAVPSLTGLVVINPQFDGAGQFSEGLASVRVGDDKTGKWGFVDKQGKFVINPQFGPPYLDFSDPDQFSGGLVAVRLGADDTAKWGYIDKQGHYVVNPQFDYAGQFSEGLAPVRIGDDKTGKYGYIAR